MALSLRQQLKQSGDKTYLAKDHFLLAALQLSNSVEDFAATVKPYQSKWYLLRDLALPYRAVKNLGRASVYFLVLLISPLWVINVLGRDLCQGVGVKNIARDFKNIFYNITGMLLHTLALATPPQFPNLPETSSAQFLTPF